MSQAAPAAEPAGRAWWYWPNLAVEWALVLALFLAGAMTLLAGKTPKSEVAQQSPFGLYFRRVIMGELHNHTVKLWLVLGFVAVVIFVQVLWPRLRPEVRGVSIAFGLFLLLAPVINYGPQIERLRLAPTDAEVLFNLPPAEITRTGEFNTFQPGLKVTRPLLLVAVLLIVWLGVTPLSVWPSSFKAALFVTLLFVLGTLWLMQQHLLARGNMNQLAYTWWPNAIASLWTMGQCLAGITAVLAVSRDELRSRVLGSLIVVLLLGTALVTRGLTL